MTSATALDELFREAVAAIDAGNVDELRRQIAAHPELLEARLEHPGEWLTKKVGKAVDGFFRRPYLLWFVAEDPVRNGTLPPNIADVAREIIQAAQLAKVKNLQEQLDYALSLVAWSWIARECGVQIELIDVLVNAGASLDGNPDNALVNGNVAAAEHLVARGAALTLSTALCLERWDDVARLGSGASPGEKQFALVLAALQGSAEGVRRVISYGADVNAPSQNLYSHGTPLHHAVCSGSLPAVTVLIDAGAELNAKDSLWHGTPLGWALYYVNEHAQSEKAEHYAGIAAYLRGRGANE